MQYFLIAIGKLRAGPEADLWNHYRQRLRQPIQVIELETKTTLPKDKRKAEEATKILAALPKESFICALDERGKDLSSDAFAKIIESHTIKGFSTFTFIIGGADGLSAEIRARAHLLLSFGKMTWPHLLVRGLLAEQLFRTECILSGHPYHRAD